MKERYIMLNYQIITDSCCDLPVEMLEQLKLKTIPLSLLFRGKAQPDSVSGDIKAFYDALREGESAATSAANPEAWSGAMEPILQEGKDVLVIAFSSGLSTTYQSAVIAANELMEKYPDRTIKVVDSLCASLGQGLLVWYACKKRDEGMDLEALTAWLEDHKLNLCHWFTVDDLMYLKRGGRVSAATALVGTMLQIKPVLHVDNEGHLINVSKARGRKASIQALAEKVVKTGLPGENDTIFICHGDCEEDAKLLAEMLKEKYGTKKVFYYYIGAVIGAHTGPGVMAVFYLGNER
jgi:DegV family protein with EDD domain